MKYGPVICERCDRKFTYGEQGYHYCKTVGFCIRCVK